jgi:hypothetical protein
MYQRLNEKLRTIDPKLIMAIHKALRTDVDNAGEDDEHDNDYLGDMLPRNALPFLLECCHNTIPMANAHEDVVLREVKAILPFCQWHSNNYPRTSLQKAVDNGSTTSHPVTAQNFRAALLAVKSHIEDSVVHANMGVEFVGCQHGALLKHTSIDALMRKLGNVVDVANATSLFEQAAALHAIECCIGAQAAAESNMEIISLIDQMLHSVESSNP